MSKNCSDTSTKPKPVGKKCKQMHGATKEEEKSHFFRMYKNTCLKIQSAIDKITLSVEASSAPAPSNPIPIMADAMKLVNECGV